MECNLFCFSEPQNDDFKSVITRPRIEIFGIFKKSYISTLRDASVGTGFRAVRWIFRKKNFSNFFEKKKRFEKKRFSTYLGEVYSRIFMWQLTCIVAMSRKSRVAGTAFRFRRVTSSDSLGTVVPGILCATIKYIERHLGNFMSCVFFVSRKYRRGLGFRFGCLKYF